MTSPLRLPRPHSASEGDAVVRRIAVAGNPNCGKTTLFNALTGLRQKVANYPGVTVEHREGTLSVDDAVTLIDLPGIYSLSARSPDEEVARDCLLGRIADVGLPDGVQIVIDASNLERNLYFATQVLELGLPAVIACNMMDVAESRGLKIDCDRLARELGVPVIPTVASKRAGLPELRIALRALADRAPPGPRPWRLDDAAEQAVSAVAAEFRAAQLAPPAGVPGASLLWLTDYLGGDSHAHPAADRFLSAAPADAAHRIHAIAADLKRHRTDVVGTIVEARYRWIGDLMARAAPPNAHASEGAAPFREPLTDRLDRILTHRLWGLLVFAGVMFLLFMSIFSWAEPLMGLIERGQTALTSLVADLMVDGPLRSLLTDGVINGVGSVVIFFPQICILFICLGILEDSGYMARAAFLMDRLMSAVGLHGKSFIPLLSSYACAIPGILATRTIEDRRDRFTTILVAPLMSCSARLPVYSIVIAAVFGQRTLLKACVMFGLYALGTGMAMLMALLFKKTLFAGPRPAFIMELPTYHVPRPWPILRATWDRSKLFLTRAGTTIFAVCVLIWALSYFPNNPSVAPVSNRWPPGAAAEPIRAGLSSARFDGREVASDAPAGREGKALVASGAPAGRNRESLVGREVHAPDKPLSEILNLKSEIPSSRAPLNPPIPSPPVAPVSNRWPPPIPQSPDPQIPLPDDLAASDRLRNSYLGRLGRAIEPAIAPLGFDWRLGIGVLSSFLAREVFVGTMGITFAVGDADETSPVLRERMAAATWPDGRRVLTPLAGISLLVFYVLACQCVSTLAVTRRETGSWRWPAFMFTYMTALAYGLSLLIYQSGRLLGLG